MSQAVSISEQRFAGRLADRLAGRRAPRGVILNWLGQAGFIVEFADRRLLIDPYLSNTLAQKYRGSPTPHERMTPAPIDLAGLGRVDLVLATHHHTDHMDPGTLAPLARMHPGLRFIVPRASRLEAIKRIGVAEDRLIFADAGDSIEPWPDLSIVALRAAHETIERDDEGRCRFLGYGLIFQLNGGRIAIVHSGDTIPFEGQAEEIRRLEPHLLLLPVNGRSEALLVRGVPGNLTLDEAVALTMESGAPAMIAHHYGLFAFNTIPLAGIERKASEPGLPIRVIPAREDLDVSVSAP